MTFNFFIEITESTSTAIAVVASRRAVAAAVFAAVSAAVNVNRSGERPVIRTKQQSLLKRPVPADAAD